MRKWSLIVLAVAVAAVVCVPLTEARPPGVAAPAPAAKIRVGTYDNRAIAIAYASSAHNPVAAKMAEYEKAKAAGDTKRVKELEAWGEKHQRQLHRQGFARAPVNDILALVKDRLPAAARAANVDVIAWTCDYGAPGVEVVDVTLELVRLFEPSERALKSVAEIMKQPPVDLDDLDHDH